jgi:hypothetical protein
MTWRSCPALDSPDACGQLPHPLSPPLCWVDVPERTSDRTSAGPYAGSGWAARAISESRPLPKQYGGRDDLNPLTKPRQPEPSACGGSSPASTSFVLAALRALHLDPGLRVHRRQARADGEARRRNIHQILPGGPQSQIREVGKRVRLADTAPLTTNGLGIGNWPTPDHTTRQHPGDG